MWAILLSSSYARKILRQRSLLFGFWGAKFNASSPALRILPFGFCWSLLLEIPIRAKSQVVQQQQEHIGSRTVILKDYYVLTLVACSLLHPGFCDLISIFLIFNSRIIFWSLSLFHSPIKYSTRWFVFFHFVIVSHWDYVFLGLCPLSLRGYCIRDGAWPGLECCLSSLFIIKGLNSMHDFFSHEIWLMLVLE